MGDTKTVSIREVAARAGVSPGTVSHVLNNNAAARIAPATQERVRTIAAELGYLPNRYARSLGRRKTDTIGLLISGSLRNPFFVELLEAAEYAALSAGFSVLLDTAPSLRNVYKGQMPIPSAWPVDGALVWSWQVQSAADYLGAQAETLPLVYLGDIRAPGSEWVAFDYELGGEIATQHLLDAGRRRIAFVTPWRYHDDGIPRDGYPIEARFQGYRRVCAATGVSLMQILTHGEETRVAGLQAGLEIASLPTQERPDALFCHNDVIAIGVYAGLVRSGLRVPEDIAIIGFDGVEEGRTLAKPLTSIRIDTAELTRVAMELLMQRIQGDRITPPRQILLPPVLLPGETV